MGHLGLSLHVFLPWKPRRRWHYTIRTRSLTGRLFLEFKRVNGDLTGFRNETTHVRKGLASLEKLDRMAWTGRGFRRAPAT